MRYINKTCTESDHDNLWFSHKVLRVTVVACTKYGCYGNKGSGGLEQQPYFTGSLYQIHLKSSMVAINFIINNLILQFHDHLLEVQFLANKLVIPASLEQ